MAYDAIGVLSMLTSMNGSGSGDPELRQKGRDGEERLSYETPCPVLIFIDISIGERTWTSTDPQKFFSVNRTW